MAARDGAPADEAPPGRARTPADWDGRYRRPGYLFGTEPNGFLVAAAHELPPGGRVLCVADGEGRNGVWLASRGHAVEGFDVSEVAVAKARALAAERGVRVRWTVADVDGFDWPVDAYDGVVAVFIQFAPPELRRRLFGLILRALRPGGVLLLTGYTPDQLRHGTGGPRVPEQLYTEAGLREELAAYEITRMTPREDEIQEGPGHSGMSAYIEVVARRPAAGD
jgi:SAM-dependent methyltransferase